MTADRTIVVAGGGITGLVAARALAAETGSEVVLLEAADRLGGKIRSARVDGLEIEAGPDSWLARDPWMTDLCRSLGLGDRLVAPAVFGALVWSRGRARRLPEGWPYGLPVAPWAGWRTGVLSWRGAVRACADLVLPGRLGDDDVSVGSFVARRFGREALERLVDPLLAGTRAGATERMSLEASLPAIASVAREYRSLILGLRAQRKASDAEPGPPGFLTLRGGLETLVAAIASELRGRARVVTGEGVVGIGPRPPRGFEVITSSGRSIECAGVVVALPAPAAAAIVASLSPEAAADLAAIAHASVAVATLVLPAGAFRPPAGTSGLLVPATERLTLSACTWFSTKWPHLRPPDGRILLRCFVGRAGRDPALELGDGELVDRLRRDLAAAIGLGAPPLAAMVTRWERALPQYEIGHLARLRRIEAALSDHPGIAVAGASYRGSGLPDCVRQGLEASRFVRRATTSSGP